MTHRPHKNTLLGSIAIAIFTLLASSCTHEKAACGEKAGTNLVCVHYEQTLCADPWSEGSFGNQATGDSLLQVMRAHYDSLGVALYRLRYQQNQPNFSFPIECETKTGTVICGSVEKGEDLKLLKKDGFQEGRDC